MGVLHSPLFGVVFKTFVIALPNIPGNLGFPQHHGQISSHHIGFSQQCHSATPIVAALSHCNTTQHIAAQPSVSPTVLPCSPGASNTSTFTTSAYNVSASVNSSQSTGSVATSSGSVQNAITSATLSQHIGVLDSSSTSSHEPVPSEGIHKTAGHSQHARSLIVHNGVYSHLSYHP
jgi:hypothetical protein